MVLGHMREINLIMRPEGQKGHCIALTVCGKTALQQRWMGLNETCMNCRFFSPARFAAKETQIKLQ
jgi:hypothetical protein